MKPAVADYQYRTMCLRIVPVSGPSIKLTHFPRALTMSNAEVYLPHEGYDVTAYAASSSLSPSVVDLTGIADSNGISRDKVASGYFDGARCYLFATSWANPVEDQEPIVASLFGKSELQDDRYRIEEMALIDALGQSVGETYTPGCEKTFGGQEFAGCKIALGPLTVTGTITSVTSPLVFRDSSRAEVADYFGAGSIRFTSGANAGLRGKEIKRHEVTGTFEVFEAFHYTVEVGDAYEMIPGCKKRLEDCRDKWNNIVNFGGDSFIPTSSQYAKTGTK